jgi:hypothetical protein
VNDELKTAMAEVARYRAEKGKAQPSEYMAYMRAREVLDRHNVEKMTAGQRAFMTTVKSMENGSAQ